MKWLWFKLTADIFLMHAFRKLVSVLRFVLHEMWFMYFVPCFSLWFFHSTRRMVHTHIRMMKKHFSTLLAGYCIQFLVILIVVWCLHTINFSFKILCLWYLIMYTTIFVQNNDRIRFILPHTVHKYQTKIWSQIQCCSVSIYFESTYRQENSVFEHQSWLSS